MAVVFVVPRAQIEEFWDSLVKKKEEIGESFWIYLDREKPVFEDNMGVIEIIDDDYEGGCGELKRGEKESKIINGGKK
jgi:hypothetical protein